MSIGIQSRAAYSAETGTRKTEAAAAEKSKNKTSSSGVKAMDVDEYMSALSKKYSYFGRTAKIANVPTSVNVSPAYLRKCADDPEKREELEKSLDSIGAFVPIGAQRTRMLPGNPIMTHYDCMIDSNGNMTVISGCTNDPKVKGQWEKAEKSGKKEKFEEEKLAERRAKKRAEERAREKAEEQEERIYRASGRDVSQITESLIQQMSSRGNGRNLVPQFDMKA